jgi:hypothetical protein
VETGAVVTVDRAAASDAPGLRALFERLDELSALRQDWDSYGGLPPTARAIGAASRLIVEATTRGDEVPAEVMPFPDGGLHVIWEQGQTELQIDVGPSGTLGYLVIHQTDGSRTMTEGEGISLAEALALVAQLPR